MKFSCTQENLSRGLQLVSHVTGRNANLPILQNILIEATDAGVSFVGTNLEIGIRARVRGKVEVVGSFTVPGHVFSNYVSLLSSERVDMELSEKALLIKAGNQRTKIQGEGSEEFPLIPDVRQRLGISIGAAELKNALAQVLIAVSHEETRQDLTGVLFNISGKRLTLAATDRYRLAERHITLPSGVEGEHKTLIPGNALRELVRILPENDESVVELFLNEGQALFKTAEVELTTRLIEGGEFPDYNSALPTAFNTTVVVDREEFIQGVKAASLFSKSGIHDINLQFDPEKQGITITSVNAQIGENVTKINSEVMGTVNSIIFNHRYTLDGLSQMDSSQLQIELVDNNTAALLRPTGTDSDDYLYVIMPIRQ